MGIAGTWNLKISTPMGEQTPTLKLASDGTGTFEGRLGAAAFSNAKIEGDNVKFSVKIKAMGQEFDVSVDATAEGDAIRGTFTTPMGGSPFNGQRAG